MDYESHLFLGGILGTIMILVMHHFYGWFESDLESIILMIIIVYIYSLLPDVDAKSSQIVWTFIPLGLLAITSGYLLKNDTYLVSGIALIAITFIAAQFMPHRGFTHSILFGLAVSLPWIYLSWNYSVLAFICFYSHLLGDEEYFKMV